MKRLAVVLVGLCVAFSVRAETVGFSLKEVAVPAFADAVFRGVLGRDYVLGGEVSREQKLTINIQSMDKSKALDVAIAALRAVGLSVSDRDGVLFVDRIAASAAQVGPVAQVQPVESVPIAASAKPESSELRPDDVVRVYRPRYRSADFLAEVVKLMGGRPMSGKSRPDMLVYGIAEARQEKVDSLLAEADGKVQAVSVRAAVLEVSNGSDESRSFGGLVELLGGKLGISIKLGKPGDNSISLKRSNLEAVLSAVEGDSRFRYVAEPRLRVLDGEQAKLTVGQDVPVRGALTQAANGAQLQAVEYKTAGVVLTLTPAILGDTVQMKVSQQVSSVTTNSASGIDSPVILRREAQTVVETPPGDVVVIAGMDETRETESRSGVPWLPAFLDGKSANKARSQIVVLLEVDRI